MRRQRADPRSRTRISVFCGGRGSAALIHELMRRSDVEVNLLVNAYDDGLSTGELRDFVPGMLGPSDFRKNLSRLLDLFSSHQFVLSRLLEYRLPVGFDDGDALFDYFHSRGQRGRVPEALGEMLQMLEESMRGHVLGYLSSFAEYSDESVKQLELSDCSIGNLIFAGAYLQNGEDFNRTNYELSTAFHSRASLINVTRGDNRILVALKRDGELLEREARVVGEQSPIPIEQIFLLPEPLGPDEIDELKPLDLEGRVRFLERLSMPVGISPEAKVALESSDIIVFGSGTQHSSLYPSYMTSGVSEAISRSRATIKALLVNIGPDHDIQSLKATEIVDGALRYLGDEQNQKDLVSHVLCASAIEGESCADRIPIDCEAAQYKGARWLVEDLQNRNRPGMHSGVAVAEKLISLYGRERFSGRNRIDVFASMNERSFAANLMLQEYLDLPWLNVTDEVHLSIDAPDIVSPELPDHMQVQSREIGGTFAEVSVFRDWLANGDSEYLVTLTGDGVYRLKDIFLGIRFLDGNGFGAVFGSRNQKRKQFFSSLHAAYGESKPLFLLSWLAAFVLGSLFSLRYKLFFSDPLTGFRIYKRAKIVERLPAGGCEAPLRTPSDITKLLIHSAVDIAEVPVEYRTFKGFTNVRWRIVRGARNAWSIVF
ncbi:MAG: 2-phospho-L-lactate transferase CofD family protein [Myxococcota bacterium]